MNAPHLRKQGNATQLIVAGQPFLVIGGELHNSSSSSLRYMKPIWPRMAAMHFNTVIAPLSWELIEPEEGRFDFALVDGLIEDARQFNLKLIFLWLASWKNGMSSYVPLWVKRNYKRFPRAKIDDGKTLEVLSTLAEANWLADAEAFAALMHHIAQVDAEQQTVIMMQVENEVGVLGDSRDRCDAANAAFGRPVPRELMSYLVNNKPLLTAEIRQKWELAGSKIDGTWEAVFGRGIETDEVFMAWHYARYIDHVAQAGKAQYGIPMYVNAWLNLPNAKPGDYPSGGPLPHVMDIWLAGAPHIDVLSPDIYAPDFEQWCGKFAQRGNPLFIPEMRRGADGARNVFYAIGQHEAIGVSPFAVDSIENPADSPLAKSYEILGQLAPLILQHQGHARMAGFLLDNEHPRATRDLGGYRLEISLDDIFGRRAELGYGLIIATGPDEFVGAGSGFGVSFEPKDAGPPLAGIGAVDEGTYQQGQWVRGRRLNGDENDQGRKWRFPAQHISIQRCTVYRYE